MQAAASLRHPLPTQITHPGNEERCFRDIFDQSPVGSCAAKTRVVLQRNADRRRVREALALAPVDTRDRTQSAERPMGGGDDAGDDRDLRLTRAKAETFVVSLGLVCPMRPTRQWLDLLLPKFLEHVPFHNMTMLTRPRRPPTPEEIQRYGQPP